MIPTLLPAYGRDYKTKAAILSDLNSDKDFLLSQPSLFPYMNRLQLIEEGITSVVVRYNQQRKVTSFKLTKQGEFK